MLVDFTVANFRSIKEPVTLSMIAAAPRGRPAMGAKRKRPMKTDEDIAPTLEVPGWDFRLVRVAAIFGANASGKSNVVRALSVLLDLLRRGPRAVEGRWRRFALDASTREAPTEFTLRVAGRSSTTAQIWEYRLAMKPGRVLSESLTEEFPSGERILVFLRERPDEGAPRSEIGSAIPAALAQLEASVAADTPFLHMLLNVVEVTALTRLRFWVLFATGCEEFDGFAPRVGMGSILAQPTLATLAERIRTFVTHLDTGIAGLTIESTDNERRVLVSHDSNTGRITWDLSEESAGTRRLIELSAPVHVALEMGSLLCEDEFGAHLHPYLTERIVRMFQSPETNPNGAQLIFNTQDTSLLNGPLLRRDQVWFTRKRTDGSTELYPLSDFKPRNDEAILPRYLAGRFGAVPVLPEDPAMPDVATGNPHEG